MPSASGPASLTADTLAGFLGASKSGRRSGEYDFPVLAPFEVVARRAGVRVLSRWFEDVSPYRTLEAAFTEAREADTFELCVTVGFRHLDLENYASALNNRARGRFAAQISYNSGVYRVSPLETISTNRSLRAWFESFLGERGLSDRQFFAGGGRLSLHDCRQFIISRKSGAAAVETYRGNEIVPTETPVAALCDDVIAGMGRWFMNNIGPDGSLPYKYWPSNGRFADTDNPIRRFMATIAFNRLADHVGSQAMRVASRRNLEFNLKRFYRARDGLGVVEWDDSIKLGAVALAGLAILESPYRDRWQTELLALRATIDRLWNRDGTFRTFLMPAERNDNQNFYPGEALLFLASALRRDLDRELLGRVLRSLWKYRQHFLHNPNPAFVPWHTQAAAVLFDLTGETSLRDYVFELTDWLLPHQQWGGGLEPDLWGRFYSPARPQYGPPHASSTGVYLEGIADALRLARSAGDDRRAGLYAEAFHRGARSIAQLQFKNDTDTYYIARKDRVLGAVRTEVYNNEIRVDNLQHALMALLKFRSSPVAETRI
ncbi:MAG: hypothetical protein AB7S92_12410 [Parvibaculaceae bacterium]